MENPLGISVFRRKPEFKVFQQLMGYEVDFLSVGEGEKSGDAIAIRHGNLFGSRSEQTVIVIDGGTLDSGERLVQHINDRYGTNRVDLVISTHPDGDHASGLRVVLKKMEVGRLWMHRPWNHAGKILDAFRDGDLTNDGLSEEIQELLKIACEIEQIALDKGVPIEEPFSDGNAANRFPEIKILGPSRDYYRELLPHFDDMPLLKSVSGSFLSRVAEAIKSVAEDRNWETLSDPTEEISAENNSSAILLLEVEGRRLLFTGDAGVPALEHAADLAEWNGINLQSCVFQQIPHHGSRRNVGPSILNRIVGPKGALQGSKTVFVSASAGGAPKHPAKKVTNAYQRRGANVLATQGQAKWHYHNAPDRWDYSPAQPIPFYFEVDE